MGIASDIVFIIIAALIGGLIAHLCRQPLIFGYILAGVAVGPYTGGITVQNIHDIEMLAEIGVALLLFTLGLEFSFGELRRVWRIAFLATPLQLLLCAVMGYLISIALGLSTSDGIWIGAAISLSSTMIVLKTLSARDALESTAGRVMLAILIAQDVAIVPMMLLLPQLTAETISIIPIATAIGKSALFLTIMYFTGVYVFPRLFNLITRQGSRELFFLSTLTVAFGTGFLSHELGLSFALGAFVAGMLLSDTDFNHQALSDVSTLRDLFALIFFVSVGMLFDPLFFVDHIWTILLLTAAIVTSKALVISSTMRVFRYNSAFSWTVGLGLAQVGEFAFVIAKAGQHSQNLSAEPFSLMIAVTVVSMVATPAFFWLGEIISRGSQSDGPVETSHVIDAPVPLRDHVIIIGGGVVGQYVARVLKTFEIPYTVIEADYKTVTRMRDNNVAVVFGDASRPTILAAAGLQHARLVVITTTNDKILPSIVGEIKSVRREVPIVVRVEEVEDIDSLSSLTVDEIVQPQLEVGLEMVRQSLLSLSIDESRVFTLLGHLRAERYEPMKPRNHHPSRDPRLATASKFLEFLWMEVTQESAFANLSLEDCRMRERFGISIVAVIRNEEYFPTPKPTFQIVPGDTLGMIGTRTQLRALLDGREQS
jgi:CPA2 family monovalent cation:H+ antiporter-2